MAAGLKINLGVLDDVANSCKEDGEVSDCAEYAQNKINKIQNKVLLMRGKTYKEFHNLLDDLEEELRGLKNNIENVSDDIAKYIDKMDDATPTNYDSEIFISSDFDRIKTMSKNLEDDFQSYTTNLVNSKLLESPPSISVEDLKDDNSESHKKKLEVYNKYTNLLTNLAEGFQCDTYITEVNKQNKNILDFYDQDYDMSDHVKNAVPKVIAAAVIGALTAEAATAIVGAETLIAFSIVSRKTQIMVVQAGITSIISFASSSLESAKEGNTVWGSIKEGGDSAAASFVTEITFSKTMSVIESKPIETDTVRKEINSTTSKVDLDVADESYIYRPGEAFINEFNNEKIITNLLAIEPKNQMGEILEVKFDKTDGGINYTYTYFDLEEKEFHVEDYKLYIDDNGHLHNEHQLSN